jgi:hypothetical protein
MTKRSMFVGMDVHKESIDISVAEEGRDGPSLRQPCRRLGGAGEGGEGPACADPAVALRLRSRSVWVWDPPVPDRAGRGVRRGQSLEHAET